MGSGKLFTNNGNVAIVALIQIKATEVKNSNLPLSINIQHFLMNIQFGVVEERVGRQNLPGFSF